MKLELVGNDLPTPAASQPATIQYNVTVNNIAIATGGMDTTSTSSIVFVSGNISIYHPMCTGDKGKVPELLVNHGQMRSKSDGFCDGIHVIKQNLTQVFKHEQEMYETWHANYLKSFGDRVHEDMKSRKFIRD